LDPADRPRPLVRPDRLAAVAGDDRLEALGDLAERVVPADALEAALALGTDAPERIQQAIGVGRVLEVAVDLDAESAAGKRVIGVAAQLGRHAVPHRRHPTAGVGTVERAGAEDSARANLGGERCHGDRMTQMDRVEQVEL
jgi:hypothetical protein